MINCLSLLLCHWSSMDWASFFSAKHQRQEAAYVMVSVLYAVEMGCCCAFIVENNIEYTYVHARYILSMDGFDRIKCTTATLYPSSVSLQWYLRRYLFFTSTSYIFGEVSRDVDHFQTMYQLIRFVDQIWLHALQVCVSLCLILTLLLLLFLVILFSFLYSFYCTYVRIFHIGFCTKSDDECIFPLLSSSTKWIAGELHHCDVTIFSHV